MKRFVLLSVLTLFGLTACDAINIDGLPGDDSGDPQNTDETYFPMPESYGELYETDDQNFYTQQLVSGLQNPWGIAFLPEGEVLITERSGNLRMVSNGELLNSHIDGLPDIVSQGQGGLLDILLHPDYEDNGWIYMSYSASRSGGTHTALMRARINKSNLSLFDQEILFEGEPGTHGANHFGSRIALRGGYVYMTTGDRGHMESSQDKSNHNGVVIRLYEDGRIPSDNPFVNDSQALDEIYSYGHRNPQGMQVHPETGEIWTHEHGPKGGDEINIIDKGINYGWPEITYGVNYDGTPITDRTEKEGMRSAIHHWTPSIAPCGMAFVTGDRYPGWKGDIMIGSLSLQYLHRTVINAQNHTVTKEEELLNGIGRVREVRMGPDGYLYFTEESQGRLFRVLPED